MLPLIAHAADPGMIAIDVGHFLKAPGATAASGRSEFEFNRDMARQIADDLAARQQRVLLIGADGQMELLKDRTAMAASAALFMSVHHDSVQPQYLSEASQFHGYSLFVSRKNPYPQESFACAKKVALALQAAGQVRTLHHAEPIAGENRPLADAALGIYWFDDLVVLKTARQPALLMETGVIVNPAEEKRLANPKEQARIASTVAGALASCRGIAP